MHSETTVRVRYAETDQMGVVYHANYLVWFEVGRVEHIRTLGLDYRSMERDENVMIAVVEATCRYKAPARYDDELTIRTHIAGIRGSVIKFTYAVRRTADDQLLATGETTHVVVGRDMRKAPMPPRYARGLPRRARKDRVGLPHETGGTDRQSESGLQRFVREPPHGCSARLRCPRCQGRGPQHNS